MIWVRMVGGDGGKGIDGEMGRDGANLRLSLPFWAIFFGGSSR